MALQLGALRDALLDAGAKPEKADRAAEELAGYESRFDGIDARIGKIKTDLAVLKWMVGTNMALTLLVLGKLFIH